MKHYRKITLIAISVASLFAGCHSDKGNANVQPPIANPADTVTTRRVVVVISSIPFPSSILDTMHNLNSKYNADLPNPASNLVSYSESNAQAANLGIYGADLAYVISFEQYQSVGTYMKVTKYLADNIGIPLAFTQDVIERCQKNQTNKDSLQRIVFQSYNVIDQTLKQNQRDASEILVLEGGWIEGVFLTTQSLSTVPQSADKKKLYKVLLQQKQYAEKLLTLLNSANGSANLCRDLVAPMQDVKDAFDKLTSVESFTDENVQNLTDKVKAIRSIIVKGKS